MGQDQYLEVAIELAKKAGSVIRDNLTIGREKTWKSDHTPVTEIDEQINQLVLDTIHTKFPKHSILAEEGSDMSRSHEYVWVCDPIDGTFPFMHGIPLSTCIITLVKYGDPVCGVIYDPFMDRLFSAQKGGGAFLNGAKIITAAEVQLDGAIIGTCNWKDNIESLSPVIEKLTLNRMQVHNYGSIAYMDALVACGEFAGVIFPGKSPHDSAAAKIIVEEAGGVFSSLTGEIDRYDQPVHGHIAAANPAIYKMIKDLLDE